MQVCDDLSRRFGSMAQGVATLEGALTGAGGVWTTLLDVPLLYTVCLTTIIKTGHCYSYPLDRPTDKAWVLGALTVALSGSKERRTDLMVQLRTIEELLLEDIQENIIIEETASLLTQVEIFEDIPVANRQLIVELFPTPHRRASRFSNRQDIVEIRGGGKCCSRHLGAGLLLFVRCLRPRVGASDYKGNLTNCREKPALRCPIIGLWCHSLATSPTG